MCPHFFQMTNSLWIKGSRGLKFLDFSWFISHFQKKKFVFQSVYNSFFPFWFKFSCFFYFIVISSWLWHENIHVPVSGSCLRVSETRLKSSGTHSDTAGAASDKLTCSDSDGLLARAQTLPWVISVLLPVSQPGYYHRSQSDCVYFVAVIEIIKSK